MFSIAFCIPAFALIIITCIKVYNQHDKMHLSKPSAAYKRYLASK